MLILKNLFLSKKFIVALLTLVGSVTTYLGWNVDPTTLLAVVSPLLVYIGAQGWADSGKEKALVEQQTAIKTQGLAMEHDVNMAVFRKSTANGVMTDPQAARTDLTAATRDSVTRAQAGSIGMGVLAILAASGVAVSVLVAACVNPRQTTLRASQCVLDSGVLDTVLADLEQPGYKKLISDLGTTIAPEVIDCALVAVAAGKPSSGSGSSAPRSAAFVGAVDAPSRARELLASRRAQN